MNIALIGAGVVGQATGIGLAAKGHEVTFYDIDTEKLDHLRRQGFTTSVDVSDAVNRSTIIMLSVPTPTINGHINLDYVVTAATTVGHALAHSRDYKVVTVRSTVLPSTTRCRVLPLLEHTSHLTSGKDFGVCFNPEFLTEKNALQDFLHPSRVVIGSLDKRSGDTVQRVYAPFDTKIIRTSLDNAEAIKYASNLFLATKISFFNELYLIYQQLGINAKVVSEAVALDPRIGHYGIWGGQPFDGKCLPKDLAAFTSFVKTHNFTPQLLEAVAAVNDAMAHHVEHGTITNLNTLAPQHRWIQDS
jgi:UDPglucose 6-dehydrogenase